MKKSDFGVIAFLYLFCAFFRYQIYLLPQEAQTYPNVLLLAIFVLTTLYAIKAIITWKREGHIQDDMAHLFDGFLPKQFWCVVAGCFFYVVLLYTVGYYVASILYMVVALALLKVKAKYIAIVIVALLIVIYLVFSLFLKVPLPVGLLFN